MRLCCYGSAGTGTGFPFFFMLNSAEMTCFLRLLHLEAAKSCASFREKVSRHCDMEWGFSSKNGICLVFQKRKVGVYL